MNLPQSFIENMSEILGPELDEYLESYEKPKFTGLRVNTSKISVEEFERIKAESLGLQRRRAELLRENGFAEDYLDIKYECPKCNDTGFVGQQMCGCFKKVLSEQYLSSSNLDKLYGSQDFRDFDLSCYAPQERAQMRTASPGRVCSSLM